MNSSVYKISLDIHTPESQETLEMKHLDSKRKIHISLTENGKVYQITPDCKAMFSAEKPDGNKVYNQCEIDGNTIIYNVTQQTLACVGEVDCEIQLIGGDDDIITSPRFSIIVHERVYNGEDIVDSEIETDVLPVLIAKSHTHDNKEVLDGITQELLDQIGIAGGTGDGLTPEQLADLAANTEARHTHDNKDILDTMGYDVDGSGRLLIGGDGILIESDLGELATQEELRALSTRIDSIEGGIDEIGSMIDESGVLDNES